MLIAFPPPVCQMVVSKKLFNVLHPVCTCPLLSISLSAAPHSVGPAERRGEERDSIEGLKAEGDLSFKVPSDRTATKEPITLLLESVDRRRLR